MVGVAYRAVRQPHRRESPVAGRGFLQLDQVRCPGTRFPTSYSLCALESTARPEGLEPPTNRFGDDRSAAELRAYVEKG